MKTLQNILLFLFLTLMGSHLPMPKCRYVAADLTGDEITKQKQFISLPGALNNGEAIVTPLENFRTVFVALRRISLLVTQFSRKYQSNRQAGRMQAIVAATVQFPCNVTAARSAQPPTNVHRVRPGDIDIIATFGDSILAGNGLIAEHYLDLLSEYRSLSFGGGGQGTWREFLTLPNILKVFNPKLYGYATEPSLTIDHVSHLNIAEPMLMSWDMPFQAKVLIERMRRDPNVDMQQHWKLLVILVGNNDMCTVNCHRDFHGVLRRYEADLRQTFTLLRNNIPRLLVLLISPPNAVTLFYRMRKKGLLCELAHSIVCNCVFDRRFNESHISGFEHKIRQWQLLDKRIAALPEFQTNDFSVIHSSAFAEMSVPLLADGGTDMRYFNVDCCHLSQLGHAVVSNILWNSLLQVPQKADWPPVIRPFQRFQCPTEQYPYIATLGNSEGKIGV